jgi:hypothetical protein
LNPLLFETISQELGIANVNDFLKVDLKDMYELHWKGNVTMNSFARHDMPTPATKTLCDSVSRNYFFKSLISECCAA